MSQATSPSTDQKRRRARGKRGGKRNKRKQSNEQVGLAKTFSSTRWSALEKEWFRTDACVNGDKIPDPILLSDITKREQSSATQQSPAHSNGLRQLRVLWWNFSKKRQRQNKSIEPSAQNNNGWQPRPIQLQSWSILMPPEKNSSPQLSSNGINMIGLSPTASGKTLAFGAPMVIAANLEEKVSRSTTDTVGTTTTIWGIVLVPTRELAQQVSKELELMISCLPKGASHANSKPTIRVLTCCGGDSQSTQDQIKILRNGPPGCRWLISATPGRLWDIIQKCHAKEPTIVIEPRYLVLDEADRLASNSDLGEQVTSIMKTCMSAFPATLAFFSATYPHKVQEHWREWMNLSNNPCAMIRVDAVSLETVNNRSPNKKQKVDESNKVEGDIPSGSSAADQALKPLEEQEMEEDDDVQETQDRQSNASIEKKNNDFLSSIPAYLVQTLHVCAEHKKPRKLSNTLDKIRKEEQSNKCRQKRSGVVFFGRIKTLQYISKLLKKQSGHSCLELHSQLPQQVRTKNMQTFQAGKVPLLLATDIAARGLHVSNIGFVINYDFPSNLEQYVHRCGRAGRDYQLDDASSSTQQNRLPPTIYSFFTRSLAPMAPDLVSLLQASKAWVDPNLLALVNELGKGGKPTRKFKQESNGLREPTGSNKRSNQTKTSDNDADEAVFSDEDDDAFPELSAKKVVLTRASHVSDASSEDDEECGSDRD